MKRSILTDFKCINKALWTLKLDMNNTMHALNLKGVGVSCCHVKRSASSELVPKAVKVLSAMRSIKTVNNLLVAAETSNLNTEPTYVGVRNSQTLQRRCLSQDLTQTSVHCDTSTRSITNTIYRNIRNNNYISESGIGGDISLTPTDEKYDLIDSETNRYSVKPDIISQEASRIRTQPVGPYKQNKCGFKAMLRKWSPTSVKTRTCDIYRRFSTCSKHTLTFDKGSWYSSKGVAGCRQNLPTGRRNFYTGPVLCSVHREFDFRVRTEPPWRVLFFGTDQISVETLKRLHQNMHSSYSVVESLEVVSNVEQRQVKSYALDHGLKVYDWPLTPMPDKYDVGVLVSFGHLIPDSIIHMFPYGILNMHPSLLPRWRGASPIIHTILNGDPETGISIMEIRPKHFDIGPLLMHRRFQVPQRCTSLQLSNILAPIGADMMVESLADLRTLERFEEEQDKSGIKYAHKLVKKNANIDWENQSCDDIDQQFRAISEVMPLRSKWKGLSVKLHDMIDPDLTNKLDPAMVRGYEGDLTQAVPGTTAYHRQLKCVLIKCRDGVVGFNNLVVRKPITAKEFLGGYLTPPDGSIFESLENDLNKYVKKERILQKRRAKI